MAVKRYIIRDVILMLILVGIWVLFNFNFFVDNPVLKRGWIRGDKAISLPYTGHGTIPTLPLVLFAFGMPLVALILTWIFVDKICCPNFTYNDIEESNDIELFTSIPYLEQSPTQSKSTQSTQSTQSTSSTPSTPTTQDGNNWSGLNQSSIQPNTPTQQQQSNDIKAQRIKNYISQPKNWAHYTTPNTHPCARKLRFALYQFFIFVTVIIFCILITTSLKYVTGELRPDFLSRCQPDYNDPTLVIGQGGWIDPKFAYICKGDQDLITAGRESFPSGHSSSSLTASTYTSILLLSRCKNRATRTIGFIVIPFIVMCVMTGGLVIATSRHWDNRHSFFDIFTGALLGIFCGLLSLLWPYGFTPSWEIDGTLLKDNNNNNDQRSLSRNQQEELSSSTIPLVSENNIPSSPNSQQIELAVTE